MTKTPKNKEVYRLHEPEPEYAYHITYWSDIQVPIECFEWEDGEYAFKLTKKERKRGYVIFGGNEKTYAGRTTEDEYKEDMVESLKNEHDAEITVDECTFKITYEEHQETP